MEVEVAGGGHHEELHVLVEEDLLDLPPGLCQHLDGELRRPAGRHRALQATQERLERVAAARVGNCEGRRQSPLPDGLDGGDGEAELQEAGQLLHVLVDVAVAVQEDIQPGGRWWI